MSDDNASISCILHSESASALLRLRDLKWLVFKIYVLLCSVRGICYNTYKMDALILLSCIYCLSTI